MINKISKYLKKNNGIGGAIQSFKHAVAEDGIENVIRHFLGKEIDETETYQKWIKKHEFTYSASEIATIQSKFTYTPKISFIIPVYNVDEVYLRACIDSIRNQYYENWELCIADDCSTKPHVKPVLLSYMEADERIKVIFREQNGHISEASNTALTLATGEYIALVDNDDFIEPEALLEVVKLINEHPETDMIYTDEDKISADGMIRSDPFFKPDWSPDAFLCHMYLCHMGIYRRHIVEAIGGFRTEFNGSQDYDFALRFTEKTKHIFHVPKVLYHWRMIPSSTASGTGSKNYAFDAGVRAKLDTVKRRGYDVTLDVNEDYGTTRFDFNLMATDFISIIVEVNDSNENLAKLLQTIIKQSSWQQFEIIVVCNNEDDKAFVTQLPHHTVTIKTMMQQQATTLQTVFANIDQLEGNIVAFLDSKSAIISPNWLETLGGQAKVGTTGVAVPRILTKNDIVQQSGVLFLKQKPTLAFAGYKKTNLGYFGRLQLNYNYLATTSTGLFIEKTKFRQAMAEVQKVQGIDNNAYQALALGLVLYTQGYFNVVRNDIDLYHDATVAQVKTQFNSIMNERLLNHWGNIYQKGDPFYNPNLKDKQGNFTF